MSEELLLNDTTNIELFSKNMFLLLHNKFYNHRYMITLSHLSFTMLYLKIK